MTTTPDEELDVPWPVFRDRTDGGRQLAARLGAYRGRPDVVVLGLPRGGVETAAEVAAALGCPLDVVVSRKIGAPENLEFAIGAVAEGGRPYLVAESVALAGASAAYVEAETARQRAEIARRQQLFRDGRPLALPADATVILVDDGVATGATVIAAIHALRRRPLARLVLAVPVAPPETAAVLRPMVDELVVLATPSPFGAVGIFYEDFRQVSDDRVTELLAAARAAGRALAAPGGARGRGAGGMRRRAPSGHR
jgi:putative phosphoribosyl transferase